MSKVTFNIPSDIKVIISKHSDINWDKVISDTLWGYVKKMKSLDSITSKSVLSDKDIDAIDHSIKAGLLKKYHPA